MPTHSLLIGGSFPRGFSFGKTQTHTRVLEGSGSRKNTWSHRGRITYTGGEDHWTGNTGNDNNNEMVVVINEQGAWMGACSHVVGPSEGHVDDNRSWSSGGEDGDIDDGGGSGGHVSTNEEYGGPETLTVDGLRFRKIKQPHSRTSIWRQMESMSIRENEANRTISDRKRRGDADEVETVVSANKKIKWMDEIFVEVLAELDDSVDMRFETYLGEGKAKEKESDERWKKEGEELLLSLLL